MNEIVRVTARLEKASSSKDSTEYRLAVHVFATKATFWNYLKSVFGFTKRVTLKEYGKGAILSQEQVEGPKEFNIDVDLVFFP